MFIFLYLLAVSFFYINFSVAIRALKLKMNNKVHITFFILQVFLALTNFGYIIAHLLNEGDGNVIAFLYQHSRSLFIYIPMFFVVIAIQLTNIIRFRKSLYLILFVYTTIIVVINSTTSPYADFIYYDNSWRLVGFVNKNVSYLQSIHYIFLFIIFNIIITLWYFKTPYKLEKKQAVILIVSSVAAVLAYTSYMVLGINILKIINMK